MTEWAAGIAIPRSSLILLKIDEKTRFTIHDVFKHEVSHIALGRAVDHKSLPLWFVEGVAVQQAGERLRERWLTTSRATLTENLLTLDSMDAGFPSTAAGVDMAYAESTAFIGYLIREYGWGHIRRVIALIRQGKTFHPAFLETFRAPLSTVEASFRRELETTASWWPILGDQGLFWGALSILAGLGLLFRWRKNQVDMANMDDVVESDSDEFA